MLLLAGTNDTIVESQEEATRASGSSSLTAHSGGDKPGLQQLPSSHEQAEGSHPTREDAAAMEIPVTAVQSPSWSE